MSTGLAIFDTTVQETNGWLKAIEGRLPACNRQHAYGALRAVLHVLRDRLPAEAVLGLSAQMPMLLRGLYLEGWQAGDPTGIRDPQTFADEVARRLPPKFPTGPNETVEAVCAVMGERLGDGEIAKIAQHLPPRLRDFLPLQRV